MAGLQMVVSRVEFRHVRRRDHGMPCSDGPNHRDKVHADQPREHPPHRLPLPTIHSSLALICPRADLTCDERAWPSPPTSAE